MVTRFDIISSRWSSQFFALLKPYVDANSFFYMYMNRQIDKRLNKHNQVNN